MNEFAVWYELGDIYLKAESYDEAIDAYSKAIQLAPNFGWPYRNLASAYLSKGLFSEAVPLLLKSIALLQSSSEKAISFNKLGDAYRQLGDYQNALQAYQQADVLASTDDDVDQSGRTDVKGALTAAESVEPEEEASPESESPVAEEAAPEPVAESIDPEAVVAPVSETPIADEEATAPVPVAGRVDPEAKAATVSDPPIAVEATVPEPVAESVELELEAAPVSEIPIAEEAAHEPAAESVDPEAKAATVSDPPIAVEATVPEPVAESVELELEAAPVSEIPIAEEAAHEPAAESVDPEAKAATVSDPPIAEEATVPEPVAESVEPELEAAPVSEISIAEEAAPESVAESVDPEAEAALETETPVMAEEAAPEPVAEIVEPQDAAAPKDKVKTPAEEAAVTQPAMKKIDLISDTSTEIALPVPSEETPEKEPAARNVDLPADSGEAKPVSDVETDQPAKTETDAITEDSAMEIAPSVSGALAIEETATAAAPVSPEVDADLLAQAAYELKRPDLPTNMFSKWVHNFRRMIHKDDLLNEALQEDFLYDIELGTEDQSDEHPVTAAQQPMENSAQEGVAAADELTVNDEVATQSTDSPEAKTVTADVELETTVSEKEVRPENEVPASSEAASVTETAELVSEHTAADTETSVPEAAPESDQPVAIVEPPAKAASIAESVEQQTVASIAPDEEPVSDAVPADTVLEDESFGLSAESRLGEPVVESAKPESEQVAESIEVQAQESIAKGVVDSDASSSPVNDPLQIVPEGVQTSTDPSNNGQDSKSAFEWNCLGNVYLKAGSYDEAVSAYTKAIELAPKVGWPYRNLASAYFYKGMTAVAIPLFKRSIELLSNNTEKASSLNKLGDAYRQLGDYQNAMVSYQKADDLSAGINSLLNKARMLVSNGAQD